MAIFCYVKRRRRLTTKDAPLSDTNRNMATFDVDDASPYVLPPMGDSTSSASPINVRPTSSLMSGMLESEQLETRVSHEGQHGHTPLLSDAEKVSLQDDSLDDNVSKSDLSTTSHDGMKETSMASISEKQRTIARGEAGIQPIIQHEDAEDIFEVPPAYKERVGGPSASSKI